MKIVIDHQSCLRSGQCAYMQPEVFDSDDDAGPSVKAPRVEGALVGKAEDAVAMCPSQSLSLVPD